MSSTQDKVKLIGLPSNIQPERYDVDLKVNLSENKFKGHEVVTLKVYDPSTEEKDHEITFNSVDLTISNVTLTLSGATHEPTSLTYDKTAETCTLVFPVPIRGVPRATLSMDFEGMLKDDLQGFYYSTYTDDEGQEHKIGVTQFEASDARRALPCWDEPSAKAVFRMTITAEDKYTILSNTSAVEETKSEDGMWKTVKFGDSPKMSSYLLAFIVGELKYVEDFTKKGVRVRVYTRPERIQFADFSLRTAVWSLNFYDEYFGIEYPLDKCDNIAIPDFSAGAMENWGLITYRETAILVDEKHTSIQRKFYNSVTVSHELSHQWFGDLVTMKWWDDLWLNEGFATYMEYFTIDKLHPEWEAWNTYVSDDFSMALKLDALESTHPVHVHVNTPSEVNEIFDDISYCKGSTVVRMLAAFVGEAKFREGLQLYLGRHKYGNTSTDDLWAALSEVSGTDVKQMMDSWVRRPGFPLLKVSRVSNRKISITQERMLPVENKKAEEKEGEEDLWWVPIVIASNDPQLNGKKVYFHERMHVVEVENDFVENLWVKVNVGQTTVTRAMYDDEFYENIKSSMKELSTVDRAGILDDAISLSQSGHLSVSSVLTLLQSYEGETDYTVWRTIHSVLNTLLRALSIYPDLQLRLRHLIQRLVQPLLAALTWDPQPGEPDQTTRLRGIVVALALAGEEGSAGPIGAEAERRFEAYLRDPATLSATLRTPVFSAVSRRSAAAWERLKGVYLDPSTNQDAKYNALLALGAPREEERLRKVYEWTLDSGEVRKQDLYYTFASGCAANQEFSGRFVMENWGKISVDGTQGLFGIVGDIVGYAFEWAPMEKLEEIKKFFGEKKCDIIARTLSEVYEKIEVRGRWRERMAADLPKFFDKMGY